MIDELIRIESLILKNIGLKILNIKKDEECDMYSGFNFLIENQNVKFRKAKRTPKKIGQFVTLWKRNEKGFTQPFDKHDSFDFCIIATGQENKLGFFLFPKKLLIEKQIISSSEKGKRGFRVYAGWDMPDNKQAAKTKAWQTKYFINLTEDERNNTEKFILIFSKYKSDL